jgi:hypothetical protein
VARERLGELLLRLGVLTQAQLVGALREQSRTGVRLGQILVDHGYVDEATLYDALAKNTNVERFHLRTAILERSALNLVTAEWALEQGLVPFKLDVQQRTLYVALTDPTNLKPVDELSFRLGLKVRVSVASETELERVIRHHFYGEALDRDPRSARRPGQKQSTGEIDDSLIMHGMDVIRDEVLKQSTTWNDGTSVPPVSSAMPEAMPIAQALQSVAPRPISSPRVAVQRPEGPPPPTIPPPIDIPHTSNGLSEQDRELLAHLKPIFDAQEEAARALRIIFEICVARGIIGREEYLERLKRTPD